MLDRATVLACFGRMSEILERQAVTGEICLVGGAAMMLAFHARQTTKDVDAAFVPASTVRAAARLVAEEMSLPTDWLNDAAKAFLSERGEFVAGTLPQFPCVRLLAPTPEYLLAMKVLSARSASDEGPGDKRDIAFLMDLLGLKTPDEAMAVVQRYCDPAQ